ncbi:hypothetical protein TanjilG_23109 [Lupinus angustifolius]|uniref:Transmembrane protein n=1 Tax=Lupinus angustifolius TaxID=3871 RepID=A0A1J7GUI7_LUPAN|nr:PREDICTED: uncharacterized protein LOC109332705 [Lupinus angustifolius]OIV93268.1 hypothetical protein TanjilG_23109 [Lupinus angustifolius]
MSTPIVQQLLPPPPLIEVTQQAYPTHLGNGSVGPVIGVLAVITVLGVIAGFIGRLCSGQRVMGHGGYDIERWVETKCSSCVDGRTALPPPQQSLPPPPPPPENDATASSMEAPQEQVIEEEEQQTTETRESSHGHNSN